MFEISVQMTKNKAISEISLVLVPANIFWYWQIFFGTGKYFLVPANIFLQKSTAWIYPPCLLQ